ncbi:hypothetical protein MMC13_003168 [Lambiella insularis]|nr:hypothetical protein [Lambiella insularis]
MDPKNQKKRSNKKPESTTELRTRTPTTNKSSKKDGAMRMLDRHEEAVIPTLYLTLDREKEIPSIVFDVKDQLTRDIDVKFIPESCRIRLEQEIPRGFRDIKKEAFRPDEPGDEGLWVEVEKIFGNAKDCFRNVQDEANWRVRVVNKVSELCEGPTIFGQDVTTQEYASEFLPYDPVGEIRMKIDWAMFLRKTASQEVSSIYKKFKTARLALSPFSMEMSKYMLSLMGIEIKKPEGGDAVYALAQLENFSYAVHACQWPLVESALGKLAKEATPRNEITIMPTIGCIIVGHDWSFFISLRVPVNRTLGYTGDTKVLCVGPILALNANTRSQENILKLIKIVKRICEWGESTYWPWFRDEVLAHVELAE